MNNKNIKLTFSLVLFLASISQAKVKNEKIEKYIDSEIIKEVNEVDMSRIKSLADRIFDEKYYSTTVLGDVNEGN